MIVYQILQETLWNSELGSYTSYAVCAYERQNGIDILRSYTSDVFLNKEEAEFFVNLCNRCNLSLVHLPDAIEDALAGAFSHIHSNNGLQSGHSESVASASSYSE